MGYWHRYYRPDLLGWKVTRIEDPASGATPQKDLIWLDADPTNLDPTKMFYIEYDPNLLPPIVFTQDLPGVAGGDAGSTFVAAGATQTLTVAASGGIAPLSYQWKKVSGGTTVNVGSNSPSYAIANYQASNNGDYYVTVTDSQGQTKDSQRIRLKVALSLSTNLTPTKAVYIGDPLTLTVAAAGGLAPYSYQWQKNGVNIAGATAATYTKTAATGDNATYTCIVKDSAVPQGSVTSQACAVTLNTLPAFTTQPPATSSVATGGNISIGPVQASGGVAPLTYQWLKDGVAVSGATSATFTKTGAASGDAGSYTCRVTDAGGKTATSTACALTVTA
ncbi:hypothetical protein sortkaff_24 [Escherichia phage sortkaff]|uniref:Ig-like domain-containing protein n=1 Tax=Escherichia phage sortkaff TaxID=2696445 RepID=A0A6C0R2G9_9CAUD|nr:hypothetical protein sortkaff_24 [Escherichia phage sortkaff]